MTRRQRYGVVGFGAGHRRAWWQVRGWPRRGRLCAWIAKGVGSTHLAPGTITDVLGYAPERVDTPADGIASLSAARPDHPYALLGLDAVTAGTDWFRATAARGALPGYGYVGSLERNLLLPTAVGALKPSAIVRRRRSRQGIPKVSGASPVVGLPPLRDFHPELCAGNLRAAGIEATALGVDVELDRADANALGLARRFDDPGWRAAFGGRLAPLIKAVDQVALPAVLGLRDPHAVLGELEAQLGRRVFEIPTLPPSVPGMRLFEILRSALRSAGGKLVIGAGVIAHHREGERV